MQKKKLKFIVAAIFLLTKATCFATTYPIPKENESLIGEIQYRTVGFTDSIGKIALRYNIGVNAIAEANPGIDVEKGLSFGTVLKLSTQHLLPNQAGRDGIVVNLPEMRMYFYLANGNVLTYPIGIGKTGKTIPITNAVITKKAKDPVWSPPDDIRVFNIEEQGIVLPKIMPPGKDNPLGPYAIYTSVPTYLIHSTIFPESIGKRASFGCIRMFESDIQEFFPIVEEGIPVSIINAPVKVGWQHKTLYMEAHPPLEEHTEGPRATLSGMVKQIVEITQNKPTLIDWQAVSYIAKERDGMPHDIGMAIS
jgi:L,D-transpeptidase ErfK/SrfK